MKRALLLALPLLCASALADDTTSPSLVKTGDGPAVLVTSQDETTYVPGDDIETAEYRSPLNAILAFVYDRATADAAAPRVKALLAANPDLPELPYETGIHLIERYDCYGSDALKEALSPLYAEILEESPELLQFKTSVLPLIDEQRAQVEELTRDMEAVSDEASAAKVAATIRSLREKTLERSGKTEAAMSEIKLGMGDMYRVMALLNSRSTDAADRLLYAYAQAQQGREGGYAELKAAFIGTLLNAEEDMPDEILQSLEPAALLACKRQAEALREWLGMAARISDKASADAAADWMTAKNTELGVELGNFWREPSMGIQPGVPQLAGAMDAAIAYLESLDPACFGSGKLAALLHYEPDEADAGPEPEPIEIYDADSEDAGMDADEDYEEE